jgi:hypothetical protein
MSGSITVDLDKIEVVNKAQSIEDDNPSDGSADREKIEWMGGVCVGMGDMRLTLCASDSFSCLIVSITWKTYRKRPSFYKAIYR